MTKKIVTGNPYLSQGQNNMGSRARVDISYLMLMILVLLQYFLILDMGGRSHTT